MNGIIKVEGGSIIVSGPVQLEGARVKASDLRAGASIVIAGLMAKGITEITGLEHIDRGYENITEKLTNLGAHVWREEITDDEVEQFQNSEASYSNTAVIKLSVV